MKRYYKIITSSGFPLKKKRRGKGAQFVPFLEFMKKIRYDNQNVIHRNPEEAQTWKNRIFSENAFVNCV